MRTFARVALTVVALAGTAVAADPLPIQEDELRAPSSWGEKKDRAVVLECVKFRDFFAPNLYAGSIPDDRLFLDDGALASSLSGRKLGGELLRKGVSNVRIAGIARDASGKRTIEVSTVVLLPGDTALFTARALTLTPGDLEGRTRLAAEARKRAATFSEDDLREWARRTDEAVLDRKAAMRPKGDASAAIAIVRSYRDLAGVTSKGISLLAEAELDEGLSAADRGRIVQVLEAELDAVRHRGRWVSHDELRTAFGLVQDGARWLRKERLELERAASAWVDVTNPRPFTGPQYETAAAKGELAIGMSRQEVARVKGRGLPAAVDRIERAAVSFDQWVMSDGARFYFARGLLFAWKP